MNIGLTRLNEQQLIGNCAPARLSALWTPIQQLRQPMQPPIVQRQIRCGICHYYRSDNRFREQYTNGKTRHQCPIAFCTSFDICGYKAGHHDQLKERKNNERKEKSEKRMRDLKAKSEARAKLAKEKKQKKLKEKKAKEDKKKKHLFARAHKLSVYLRNIGVKET